MPHIIVKMFPGRSDVQKEDLTNKIVQSVLETTGCNERSISIAIEEVEKEDWQEKVYNHDILGNENLLVKKPGYGSMVE